MVKKEAQKVEFQKLSKVGDFYDSFWPGASRDKNSGIDSPVDAASVV